MAYRYLTTVAGNLTPAQRTSLQTLVDKLWPGQMANVRTVLFERQENGVAFAVTGKIEVADATSLPTGELVVERI